MFVQNESDSLGMETISSFVCQDQEYIMAQEANSFVNFTRYMRINSLKP